MPFRQFLMLFASLAATPALGREPERPVTDKSISAADVAATPVTDLNLRKNEIPAVLLSAQDDPYTVRGLTKCTRIAAAVGELDAVLGEDIDVAPDQERRGPDAGKLAQWAVASFIPFRGAIRELSGANETQRRLQVAIQAGISRRAFLKGMGQARGCRYPARAATPAVLAGRARIEAAELASAEAAKAAKKEDKQ